MKRKAIIIFSALFAFAAIFLSGCSKLLPDINNESDLQQSEVPNVSQTGSKTDETSLEETRIEFNSDQKIFLEISIDTKENELEAIAQKYGYHIDLTRYNAGTSNRDSEQNYVYELYDPSQFRNETEEKWRTNRLYYGIQITYYHSNDDYDNQYIVSCVYSKGKSGKLVEQTFDVSTGKTEYLYWKQVTTAPAHKDENWHSAVSAEEALIAYLSD